MRGAILLGVVLVAGAAQAGPDHDSRRLTPAEQRAFFPLVCREPVLNDRQNTCAKVNAYPGASPEGAFSLSLDAVARGSFTRRGADQAYVTYAADFEPHANNFGGGILFEHSAGRWRLKRWYPGGQMDHCLALPEAGTQAMLCLTGWTGQGEVDSSVWLRHVPDSGDASTVAKASTAVLKAQDDRQAGMDRPIGNYQCTLKRAKDEAILLSVDDLKRSKADGVFAESKVTYAAARDADKACRKKKFAEVPETTGSVRFVLSGGKVTALAPASFARPDR